MAEIEQIIIKGQNQETISYIASPTESVFSIMLRDKFRAVLGAAVINEHGQLVSVALSPFTDNKLVAFQYKRLDIMGSHPQYLVRAYKHLHPAPEYLPEVPEKDEDEKDYEDIWERIGKERDEMRQITAEINKGIEARNSGINPVRLLTDPIYILGEARIAQYPEHFDVSIFEDRNKLPENIDPEPLTRKGQLAGVRPDVHTLLRLSPRIEGIPRHIIVSDYPDYDDHLHISYPRVYYQIAKAFCDAYYSYDEKLWGGCEADDVAMFAPANRSLSYPIFPDQRSQQEIMDHYGSFIEGLTRA